MSKAREPAKLPGRIDQLKNQTLEFCRDNKRLSKEVEKMFGAVGIWSRLKMLAYIPIRHLKITALDISELGLKYGEEYELAQYYQTRSGDNYTSVKRDAKIEDLEAGIEEVAGDITSEENTVEEFEAREAKGEKLDTDEAGELAAARIKIEELTKKQSELIDEKDEVERAEIKTDELMWNVVWVYDGIDEDVVAKIGNIGAGRFTPRGDVAGDDDENPRPYVEGKFIYLTACGMSITPSLVAYELLDWGGTSPDHAETLNEIDYFADVAGSEAMKLIYEKYEIPPEVVAATRAKGEERMKLFEKDLKQARKLMKTDPILGGLAALMSLSRHNK